eukprot:2441198-Amphidinium_carterae.1
MKVTMYEDVEAKRAEWSETILMAGSSSWNWVYNLRTESICLFRFTSTTHKLSIPCSEQPAHTQ